ncbi:GAF domain-containing protein [Pseudonocardia sp. DLS-67]
MTDGLLLAAGRGDLRALAAFYDQTVPVVFGLLSGVLGEAAWAERATERVYLQLWRTAPQFDPTEGSAFSLLLRTARRELIGHVCELVIRSPSRTPAGSTTERDAAASASPEDFEPGTDERGSSPSSWADAARVEGAWPVGEPGEVTRALLAIARDVADDRALAEQICRACVAGLDIDGAAISLSTATASREMLFASDATADLLDELQFTLGEGTCMEAALTGRPVLVPDMNDTADARRWPVFAAAAVEQAGAGAIFALPLQWGTVELGVLDLYRRAPGSLSAAQLREAMSVGDTAALMLLELRTDPGDDHGWDTSWGRRAEVQQAAGMVVAQLGLNASDAFARLRAHAFAENQLLGDVAHDVVNRQLRFTEDV